MIKRSKLVYGVGSAIIGIVVIIFVFAGLVLSGAINAETRKLVFESASKEFVYDGQTFTCEEWSLVSGELKSGHEAKVSVYGKQTGVGTCENAMSVTIIDANGADVSSDYQISCQTGVLSVSARPLTVETGDAKRVYDGTPLKAESYELTAGTIADGHTLEVAYTGEQTNVGETENAASVTVVDANGNDVTNNYAVTVTSGTLEVTARALLLRSVDGSKTYDGEPLKAEDYVLETGTLVEGQTIVPYYPVELTNVGTAENEWLASVTTADGADVTDNYEIAHLYGSLQVLPCEILVRTLDAEKTYDGAPLTQSEWTYMMGEVLPIHTFNVVCTGTQTDVGNAENDMQWTITDENGVSVGANYRVTVVKGSLKVTPKPIRLYSESQEWVYDGQEHTHDQVYYDAWSLVDGHQLIGACTVAVQNVEEKAVDNKFEWVITDANGRDVSENYKAMEEYGKLSILPRELTVYTDGYTWRYDGQPHSHQSWYHLGEVAFGQTLEVNCETSITNVKESPKENAATWKVLDGNGVDVSGNYKVTEKYGELNVVACDLLIATQGYTWTYDGQSHSYDASWYEGEVAWNHNLEIVCEKSITNVKDSPMKNKATWRITDEYGLDVSENYNVAENFGELKLEKRDLKIATGEKTWQYDGQTHKHEEKTVSGNLAFNHTLDIEFTGSITNVKESPKKNEITWSVLDENGFNVSENYNVTVTCGELKLEKRNLKITTEGKTWLYDGQAHKHEEKTVSGDLAFNHTLDIDFTASITNVKESPKKNEITCRILDENGFNVSDNYNVTVICGELKLEKRDLTAQSGDDKKEYDGEVLRKDEVFLLDENELANGHTWDYNLTGAITDAGTAENTFELYVYDENGVNVSENYNLQLNSGKLEITPRPIAFSTGAHEKIYDGYALNVDLTASCKVTSYKEEESALLDGHYYVLIQQDTQEIIDVSQTPLDNRFVTMRIYDANDNDVTRNYEINYLYQKLVIKPRPITIESLGASKTYDGQPLTEDGYSDDFGIYGLADGHWEEVRITGSRTEVGESLNTVFEVIIYDAFGKDSTSNYQITVKEGSLIVIGEVQSDEKEENVTPPPEEQEIGLPDEIDLDTPLLSVTATYAGKAYLRRTSFGAYTGSSWLAATEYDGLLNNTYSMNYLFGVAVQASGVERQSMQIEHLVSGLQYTLPYHLDDSLLYYQTQTSDTAYIGSTGSKYAAYYYPYEYLLDSGVKTGKLGSYSTAEKSYRDFVYNEYLALPDSSKTYMNGIIAQKGWTKNTANIIRMVASYIANSAAYDLEYNRALDSESDVYVSFLRDYKTGVCQHYAGAATLLYRALGIPARYTVGYTAQTKENEAVIVKSGNAHAWVEIYLDGIGWTYVEVTGGDGTNGIGGEKPETDVDDPNELIIAAKSVSKRYDGTPLDAINSVSYCKDMGDLLKNGYDYEVTVAGTQTEVGRSRATITSFRLFDPDGNDVTDTYRITLKQGTLHVYLYTMYVTTGSATEIYNGKALTNAEHGYSGLQNGHQISIVNTGSQINVGSSSNTCSVHVYDEDGNDVTVQYKIQYSYGTLTVTALQITVVAGSREKEYDGTALTFNSYTVTGVVVSTHTVHAVVEGSQTRVGKKANKITEVTVTDENGKDVTSNYVITSVEGLLTVKASA